MTEFLTLTFIGLLMIISPGPDFAMVTKLSLVQGRSAGVSSAFGISLANLCHVAINLFGIGLIIAKSIVIFTVMKILGAIYLLYIGYKGLRAKASSLELSSHEDAGKPNSLVLKGLLTGFTTSLLNPKACLFYLSFFSVLLSPEIPFRTQIFYGSWLSLLALFWFILVAIFFTNPVISEKLKTCKHWIERVAGGALIILGFRLLGTKAVF